MRTRNHPNSTKRGSTHTFIFTHAPIVNGTIKIGISMDATHVSPNDYRFVYWITKTKPTPNIEAIFVGHTHANVADFLKGVKSGEANDRNIDWSGSKHTTGTFYYSNYPVCFQEYKSTG